MGAIWLRHRLHEALARQNLIAILIITLTATLAFVPIIIYGFPRGSDTVEHYRWAYQLTEQIREGVLYARWFPGANKGYGAPIMIYRPPLSIYLTSIFNLFTNTWHAMALSCWLSTVMSGLTMYFFSRSLLSHKAGILVAVAYMLAPYNLYDIYQGAVLSEFWSFVWIPLVLDSIRRIVSGANYRSVVYLALSYGLMLLTHVPLPLIVTLLLPIFVLALTRRLRDILRIASGLALGVGISAAFLVPVLFEKKYLQLDRVLDQSYENSFVSFRLRELFQDPSLQPGNHFYVEYMFEMRLVALGLILLLAISALVIHKRKQSLEETSPQKTLRQALWIISILSLLMSTRISQPIWRAIPQLPYIEFPGRWLAIATISTFLLCAFAFEMSLRTRRKQTVYLVAVGLALSINVAVSLRPIAKSYYRQERVEQKLWGREIPESRTVWWDGKFREEFQQAPVVVDTGIASVDVIKGSGIKQSYDITADTLSVLRFRSLYFPGWVARTDGRKTAIEPSKEGNIELAVDQGEHHLSLSFEDTWPRTLGKFISVLSILMVVAMLYIQHAYAKRLPARRRLRTYLTAEGVKLSNLPEGTQPANVIRSARA